MFTRLEESLPPENTMLAVLCFGFDVKAATFDGCNFYDKETGGQLALGSVKAWLDVSHYNEWGLPLLFSNLNFYVNTLKSMSDSLSVEK